MISIMNSKTCLSLIFALVIVCMLAITTWASTYESVFVGARKILSEPWGVATFADTYFGFLTFYIWVFYKESSWLSKLAWLILILALGNIAMAAYVLWQVYRLPEGKSTHLILLRSAPDQNQKSASDA